MGSFVVKSERRRPGKITGNIISTFRI